MMSDKGNNLRADEVMKRLDEAKAIVISASKQLMSEKFTFHSEEVSGKRKHE